MKFCVVPVMFVTLSLFGMNEKNNRWLEIELRIEALREQQNLILLEQGDYATRTQQPLYYGTSSSSSLIEGALVASRSLKRFFPLPFVESKL